MVNNSLCARIAEEVRKLDYWEADWQIEVSLGRPNAWKQRAHPYKSGRSVSLKHRRGWLTYVHLQVPHTWLEDVLAMGLAVLPCDHEGGSQFCLAAWDRPIPEGAAGCWLVDTVFERGSKVCCAEGHLVRFAGRDWYTQGKPQEAMARAFKAVEAGLGLEGEVEIPF